MNWKEKKVCVLSQAHVHLNNLKNWRQILAVPPWALSCWFVHRSEFEKSRPSFMSLAQESGGGGCHRSKWSPSLLRHWDKGTSWYLWKRGLSLHTQCLLWLWNLHCHSPFWLLDQEKWKLCCCGKASGDLVSLQDGDICCSLTALTQALLSHFGQLLSDSSFISTIHFIPVNEETVHSWQTKKLRHWEANGFIQNLSTSYSNTGVCTLFPGTPCCCYITLSQVLRQNAYAEVLS